MDTSSLQILISSAMGALIANPKVQEFFVGSLTSMGQEHFNSTIQSNLDKYGAEFLNVVRTRQGELPVNHHLQRAAHRAFALSLLVMVNEENFKADNVDFDAEEKHLGQQLRRFAHNLVGKLERGVSFGDNEALLVELFDQKVQLNEDTFKQLIHHAQTPDTVLFLGNEVARQFHQGVEQWIVAGFCGNPIPPCFKQWLGDGFAFHPSHEKKLADYFRRSEPDESPQHITLFRVWSLWFHEMLKTEAGAAAFKAYMLEWMSDVSVEHAEIKSHVQAIQVWSHEEHAPRFDDISQKAPTDATEPSIGDLVFRQQWLPMFRRPDEENQLWEFLDGDEKFAWWGIVGEAGVGKSRLALDLVLEARANGWRAGFLQDEKEPFGERPEKWQPTGNVLLVIDYASRYQFKLLDTLNHWSRGAEKQQGRLRVLILDRPGAVQPLFSERIQSISNTRVNDDRDNARQHCHPRRNRPDQTKRGFGDENDLISLEGLPQEEWNTFLTDVAERVGIDRNDFEAELTRIAQNHDWDEFLALVKDVTDEGRPLLLQLLGRAMVAKVRDKQPFDPSQTAQSLALMEDMLQNEVCKRWGLLFFGDYERMENEADKKQWRDDLKKLQRLVAIVTVCRGVSQDELNSLCDAEGIDPEDYVLPDTLKQVLHEDTATNRIRPFEPDLLAERFVLMGGIKPDPRNIRAPLPFTGVEIIEKAMAINPFGVAQFLQLAMRDFTEEAAPLLAAAISLVPEPDIDLESVPKEFDKVVDLFIKISSLLQLWLAAMPLAPNSFSLNFAGVSQAFREWASFSEEQWTTTVFGLTFIHQSLRELKLFSWLSKELDEMVSDLSKTSYDSDCIGYWLIAITGANAINAYGEERLFDDVERWAKRLENLPATSEIQLIRAQVAVNAINYYGQAEQFDDVERWAKTFENLPNTPEIQLAHGIATYNAINYYGQAERFSDVERWAKTFENLPATPGIQLEHAKIVSNAIYHYGKAEYFGDVERWAKTLEKLPDTPKIQLQHAKTVVNAMSVYGNGTPQRFDDMERWGKRLEGLPDTPEIQLERAKAAFNAINDYGTAGRFDDMERCGQILLHSMPAELNSEEERNLWVETIYKYYSRLCDFPSTDVFARVADAIEARFVNNEHGDDQEAVTMLQELVAQLPATADDLKEWLSASEAEPLEEQRAFAEFVARCGFDLADLRQRVGLVSLD